MLKSFYRFFLLFLCISCLYSCSLTAVKDESPKINSVENGTKFKINLPEDHSNGYLWQLSENYNKDLVKNCGAVWHGVEKGIDFNLQALSTGQTTLSFVLWKYNDTVSNKSFIVNIINK
jgi:predicted secreted protein